MEYSVSGHLSGTVAAPVSKSDLHRLLIAASLCSNETTVIHPYTMNHDIRATASVMERAGASIEFGKDCITVTGSGRVNQNFEADCDESGSTLRFLIPVLAALNCQCSFSGRGRLPERPVTPLMQEMAAHGITFSAPALPFSISGSLQAGTYQFPGNISSQYITGLLMALPLLPDSSSIVLTSPLESQGYVDMTLSVLKRFHIRIEQVSPVQWNIPGGQTYHSPGTIQAEGDWSNSAFWLTAGALGGPVTVSGLSEDSLQGDRAICSILSRMGAQVTWDGSCVTVSGGELHGIDIDGSQIPDIIPILSIAASFTKGVTRIVNAGRLRIKESDRLSAVTQCLTALGAKVEEGPDYLVITGAPQLSGGKVDSFHDHRIAMSMAIASEKCREPVCIRDPLCVQKSYPDFYDEYQKLGGAVHVLNLGESH